MLRLVVATVLVVALAATAQAGGWDSFDKYEHRTGRCGGMREVGASFYNLPGSRLSTGGTFSAHANACASNAGGFAKGSRVTLTNPHNGMQSYCVVNDTLPHGRAWKSGVRLDLTPKVFRELGLSRSRWICAS